MSSRCVQNSFNSTLPNWGESPAHHSYFFLFHLFPLAIPFPLSWIHPLMLPSPLTTWHWGPNLFPPSLTATLLALPGDQQGPTRSRYLKEGGGGGWRWGLYICNLPLRACWIWNLQRWIKFTTAFTLGWAGVRWMCKVGCVSAYKQTLKNFLFLREVALIWVGWIRAIIKEVRCIYASTSN